MPASSNVDLFAAYDAFLTQPWHLTSLPTDFGYNTGVTGYDPTVDITDNEIVELANPLLMATDEQLAAGVITVQGRVSNLYNESIPDVTVSITGTAMTTTTDSAGYFKIENAPIRSRVSIDKDGYISQNDLGTTFNHQNRGVKLIGLLDEPLLDSNNNQQYKTAGFSTIGKIFWLMILAGGIYTGVKKMKNKK